MIAAWLRRVSSTVVLRTLLFVAVFSLAAVPPLDPDLWWHLANGRLIVTTGSIPHVDVYSFSAAGQPWVMHEWLVDLGMYLLYQLGGLPSLVAIFAAVVTAAAVCLYLLLRQTGLAASAAFAWSMMCSKPDNPSSASAGSTTTSRPPGRNSLARTERKACQSCAPWRSSSARTVPVLRPMKIWPGITVGKSNVHGCCVP